MTTNRYLLKIKPLGNFFFGNERKFNADGKVNYLVKSNQYPQQTTLLGMLRFMMLQQDEALAGEHGFKENHDEAYGNIECISPVFLMKNEAVLLEAGFNHQEKNEILLDSVAGKTNDANDIYHKDFIPNLKQFDLKKTLENVYLDWITKAPFHLENEKIFTEAAQIGIKKNYKGNTDDEAFFKQTFYRMNKAYSFGLFIETKESLKDISKSFKQTLGADQSLFRIDITKQEELSCFEQINVQNEQIKGDAKVVLLSDALVKTDVRSVCEFSFIETGDFRYISTNLKDTKRFYNISEQKGDAKKSERYTLIKRGSVLFTKDVSKLKEVLSIPAFQRIGYNYFQIYSTSK